MCRSADPKADAGVSVATQNDSASMDAYEMVNVGESCARTIPSICTQQHMPLHLLAWFLSTGLAVLAVRCDVIAGTSGDVAENRRLSNSV